MTTVQKLGNSFALIVTQQEARVLGFAQGDKVTKEISDKKITFEKIEEEPKVRKYTLEELVKGITKKNRHKAVDWGYAVGNEIIDDDYSK